MVYFIRKKNSVKLNSGQYTGKGGKLSYYDKKRGNHPLKLIIKEIYASHIAEYILIP